MTLENEIYVSYAHTDSSVVELIIKRLREQVALHLGYDVRIWMDFHNIAAGDDFQQALDRALHSSQTMLAFVSNAYLSSRWTLKEFETFDLLDRPIFPVVMEQFPLDRYEIEKVLGTRIGFWAPPLHPDRPSDKFDNFLGKLASEIANTLEGLQVAPSQSLINETKKPETPAKGYVFLSYAEEDADFLEQLRSFFGDHGYAYWEFEKSDRDYQKRIDLELESVITNAVATVSILSDSWKTSDWSVRELYFSQEIKKPVFLLKAKPFGPMLAIAGLPYIDFTKGVDEAFSRLERELKRAGL